jgi:hypothetical protein
MSYLASAMAKYSTAHKVISPYVRMLVADILPEGHIEGGTNEVACFALLGLTIVTNSTLLDALNQPTLLFATEMGTAAAFISGTALLVIGKNVVKQGSYIEGAIDCAMGLGTAAWSAYRAYQWARS